MVQLLIKRMSLAKIPTGVCSLSGAVNFTLRSSIHIIIHLHRGEAADAKDMSALNEAANFVQYHTILVRDVASCSHADAVCLLCEPRIALTIPRTSRLSCSSPT